MLTQDDIKLLEKMFGQIRKEIVDTSLHLEGRLVGVEHRLKNVEVITKETGTKVGNLEKSIDILEMKTELFNSSLHRKIDKHHLEVADAVQRILDTMDELNNTLLQRVNKIEKHLSISHT